MPNKTYSGTFTSNGDGTGTWKLSNGESGTFATLKMWGNNFQVRYRRSNGSILGDAQGVAIGNNGAGRFSGKWTASAKNGFYQLNNFRNGELISSTGFQSPGDPFTIATYTLSSSATSINEGQMLTTTLQAQGVSAGTRLYYTLNGNGINAADFSSGALTGSAVVSTTGNFSLTHTLAEDKTTEGNETLEIRLFSDANHKQQLGNTASVTVVDSSKSLNGLSTAVTPKWSALTETQLWDLQLSQDESQVAVAGQRGFTAIAAGVRADNGTGQWASPLGNHYYRATRIETIGTNEYLIGASAADSNKMPTGAGWQKLNNQGKIVSSTNITGTAGKVYGVTAGFARGGSFIDIFNQELEGRSCQPCIRKDNSILTGGETPELLVHCATINESGDTAYMAGWEKNNRNSAAIYRAKLGANSATWSKVGDIETTSIACEELNINKVELDELRGTLVFCGDSQSYTKPSSYGLIGELNTSTGTTSIQQIQLSGRMGGGNSSDSISNFKILNDRYLLATGFDSTGSQELQGRLYLFDRQTKATEMRTVELPDTKWDLIRDIEVDSDSNIFLGGAGIRALGKIDKIFPGNQISSTIKVSGKGTLKGSPRGDSFIIDSNNHDFPVLDGNGGRDKYYLSEDVNARKKLAHPYTEGGGSPSIEIQPDDSVFLPSSVAPKDIVFWNTFSSRTHRNTSVELVYDPSGLYRQIFAPSPYNMTWFDGDILVGGGVSDFNNDGIADDGDPRAIAAYNLRRTNPKEYKLKQKNLTNQLAARPSWPYETDRLATLSMKDSTSILDIASRIFQSDGSPAFDGNKATAIGSL